MADISQINLPDGSSVNIKDATARSDKMDKINPTGTGTFSLKDGNGTTKVSLNSSTGDISCTSVNGVTPTEVVANPSGTGSADLAKIQIGNSIYNIPQGGGSGGHTILDNEGTSLTQRDDLQFKGAYSEDDSTNDKTVVNVARTMTLAEFEQLTDDEKAGFINVKDETGGSDDKFQPVIYSSEEREIGVWIDGKPLYQKTVTLEQTLASQEYYTLISDSTFTLIGYNSDSTKFIRNNGQVWSSSFGYGGGTVFIYQETNGDIRFSYNVSDVVIIKAEITLLYTKTTDQAGSGQWTPQGVPTHHYSTDEHIVGTWIDGSTIYEKTYDLSSNPITIVRSWVKVATDPTVSQIVNAIGLCGVICENAIEVRVNNSDIQIERVGVNEPDTRTLTYLTIQYTKTST